MQFNNKTIVNFGDSIFGNRRPPNDISTKLAEITGATVYNCGFGGCRMSAHLENWDSFSMYRLAYSIVNNDWTLQDTAVNNPDWTEKPEYFDEALSLLKSIDFSKVDIVTIAYGTNDFTACVSMENKEDEKDIKTFAGAMRYSIETLLGGYPHLKIFVCSQTYRFWMDADGVYIDDSDLRTNEKGFKLPDYVQKTKEIATHYHLPFIDNYNIGMSKFTRSVYFSPTDGTHPIQAGCDLIASNIAKELF